MLQKYYLFGLQKVFLVILRHLMKVLEVEDQVEAMKVSTLDLAPYPACFGI